MTHGPATSGLQVVAVVMRERSATVTTLGQTHELAAPDAGGLEDQVLEALLSAAESAGGAVHVRMTGTEAREFVLSADGEVADVPVAAAGLAAAAATPAEAVTANGAQPETPQIVIAPEPSTASTSKSSRGTKRLALLLVSVLVLAAGGLAVLLGRHGVEPKVTPTAASSELASPSATLTPSSSPAPPARTVRVRAAGRVHSVRLTVTATRLPVMATVTVDPAGPAHAVRTKVVLRRVGQVIVVDGLRAGKARWRVSVVDGRVAASGTVTVSAPQPPASPAATVAPTAAPTASPTHTHTHTATHHHHTSSGGRGPVGPGSGGPTGPVR
ncbi:hypothetical protein GCM10028801_44700 [Nocardioides maradonensis]